MLHVNVCLPLLLSMMVIKWTCMAVKFDNLSTDSRILTLYNLDFTECKDSCDARSKCSEALYSHRQKSCHLLSANMATITGDPLGSWKMAVYRKSTPTMCGGEICDEDKVCLNNTCQSQECKFVPESQLYHLKGNVFHFGSRINITCKEGCFQAEDTGGASSHVCGENGQWVPPLQECIPATCPLIGSRLGQTSGEYTSIDEGSGEVVDIYCAFEQGYGHTYISSESLAFVTNISRYVQRTDYVKIQFLKSDNLQYTGRIEILPQYAADGNITVLLNDYNGFFQPSFQNFENVNYIYLQLVPPSFNFYQGVTQGYRFQNKSAEFVNDGDPLLTARNHFITFTGDVNDTGVENCQSLSYQYDISCTWVEEATITTKNLPSNYFYKYTMHMGGGGTHFYKLFDINGKRVETVSFGFRFDI